MQQGLGSIPKAGTLDSGYDPSEVGEMSNKFVNSGCTVEDGECKPQVWACHESLTFWKLFSPVDSRQMKRTWPSLHQ